MTLRLPLVFLGLAVLGVVAVGALLFLRGGRPSAPATPTPTAEPLFGSSPAGPGTPLLPSPSPGSTATAVLCADTWAGHADADGDGLPNEVEQRYETDAENPDSDSDGHTDGDEVRNGYNPKEPGSARLDSDSDGLLEHEECQWKTDPFNPDTDGDGFQDGAEVQNGFDPTVRGDGKGSDRLTPAASPAPVAAPAPTRAPAAPQPRDTTLPPVQRSELNVVQRETAADIRTYLTEIGKGPAGLSDTAEVSRALTDAILRKNPERLKAIRVLIRQYQAKLRSMPVPEPAVAHHTLLIQLTTFVNDRLGVIETNAGKNERRLAEAALELQTGIPRYLRELSVLRAQLDARTRGL